MRKLTISHFVAPCPHYDCLGNANGKIRKLCRSPPPNVQARVEYPNPNLPRFGQYAGGAVYIIQQGSALSLIDSKITYNFATVGGGIAAYDGANVTLVRSTVAFNGAEEGGGRGRGGAEAGRRGDGGTRGAAMGTADGEREQRAGVPGVLLARAGVAVVHE